MKSFKMFVTEGDVIQFPVKKAAPEAPAQSHKDHFNSWHKEAIGYHGGHSIATHTAYNHYYTHADEHDVHQPMSYQNFHKAMTDKGYHTQHIAGKARYIGLHFKYDYNDDGERVTPGVGHHYD